MTNLELIGRDAARRTIRAALASANPELIAVWGRRRVGKTFLIRHGRQPAEDHYFEATGRRNGTRREQLAHFMEMLLKTFQRGLALPLPKSWDQAFNYLADAIESSPQDGKPITAFFDEAPWLDSRRSGFLDALEYFWNAKGTKHPRLKVFVCGSAASWVVRKIVNGKGGWHRRITGRLRVEPFKLSETEMCLARQGIQLARIDILRLYMVLGGIPYYLSLMRRGESIAAFIDRLFFSETPDLQSEFDELYDSLFDNSAVHKRIVSLVARTKAGLTRAEIAERSKVASGGNLNRYIENLEQSGFIEIHEPLGATGERFWRYRVSDMFTLFHLQWLARRARMRSWHGIATSQPYKFWCGHAFETVAWNHAAAIAEALGISKSDYSVTRADLENKAGRAQIDLLFDVRGGAVYLLELKFCDVSYAMTAAEADKLLQRRKVLSMHYKDKRSIIVCLLAPARSPEQRAFARRGGSGFGCGCAVPA